MDGFPTSLLIELHMRLLREYGDPCWWPGDTPFEIAVGAVLTQNTAWANVEKAISNLRTEGLLEPGKMRDASHEEISLAVKPAGYYNQKARCLMGLSSYLELQFDGDLTGMRSMDRGSLRSGLLSLRGIGEETADSILCYSLDRPVLVVDAYTRRLFKRISPLWWHELFPKGDPGYSALQAALMGRLRGDAGFYNRFHALVVVHSKERCRKIPLCSGCPLKGICVYSDRGELSGDPSENGI